MPPIVAKVVDVHHRLAFGQKQFGNRHYTFVNDLDITVKSVIIWHAPILAVLLKLVKMAVGPTEDGLESVVEAAQGYRTRNLDSPPNGRFDVEERDLQFVDGWFGFCGRHQTILSSRFELPGWNAVRWERRPAGNCRPAGRSHVQRRNMRLQCGCVARLNHEHYVGGGLPRSAGRTEKRQRAPKPVRILESRLSSGFGQEGLRNREPGAIRTRRCPEHPQHRARSIPSSGWRTSFHLRQPDC